jgi:hypothetical protein
MKILHERMSQLAARHVQPHGCTDFSPYSRQHALWPHGVAQDARKRDGKDFAHVQ